MRAKESIEPARKTLASDASQGVNFRSFKQTSCRRL